MPLSNDLLRQLATALPPRKRPSTGRRPARSGSCRRPWLFAAAVAACVHGAPVLAAATTIPIVLPPGTDTGGVPIPIGITIPAPVGETVNPLGLAPGLYWMNLGKCMGSALGDCKGGFVTHAASKDATGGLPLSPDAALAQLANAFDPTAPSAPPVPTTMPGWSLFALNMPATQTVAIPPDVFGNGGSPSMPWSQRALSVANAPSIEMPLAQLFGLNDGSIADLFSDDPRSHWFGRSESYDRLNVGWSDSPFLFPAPEFHVASLSLRAVELDLGSGAETVIIWETWTTDRTDFDPFPAVDWRIGVASITPGDVLGNPLPLSPAQILALMLSGIDGHLQSDEPEVARQAWLSLNPMSLLKQDDWRAIAREIQADLAAVLLGKESNFLSIDGSFRFNVRDDVATFLLPEPAAVPEPATLALLGLGLAGVAASRRRVRRSI